MVINGVELELDLLDADMAEKFESECQRVKARVTDKKAYEGKSNPDAIRYQCEVVNDFFDSIFGYGTSEKVFEGRHHIGKSMEAFATVVSEANKSGEKIKEISREYMPGDATPNRAARRKHKKGRGNMSAYQGTPPMMEHNMLIDPLPKIVYVGGEPYAINSDFRVTIAFEILMRIRR